MREIRYDRQLRLWGNEGQSSIEAAAICILGADALATEIGKSLVLAGVGSIVIIDGEFVTDDDLGSNFFYEDAQLGQQRGQAAASLLQELNPSVKVSGIDAQITKLQGQDILAYGKFSLVIATNLLESRAAILSDEIFQAGIPFINCRTYGLVGYIRVSAAEHHIMNTRTENPRPDFRLDAPFPELVALFDELDFGAMDHEKFKHTPYIFLLMQALKMFRENKKDPQAFPKSYAERKQIVELISSLSHSQGLDEENLEEAVAAVNRCMHPTLIPSSVQEIFDSPKCSENTKTTDPFWMICYALKQFVERHGYLPVSDSLPDMSSDSKSYARLLNAFRQKAEQDAEEMLELTREVEQTRGTEALISQEQCRKFCKGSRFVAILRGTPIKHDMENGWNKAVEELSTSHGEDNDVAPITWFILLRAADRFMEVKKRHPGTNGVPMSLDVALLSNCVAEVIADSNVKEKTIAAGNVPRKAIEEFCRFGSSFPHVTAALIGGIVAQEAIKLTTNQYIPLNDTLIINLHSQKSWTARF
ncbi:unnamed protein product, partial [Mesorhabditis belari]|uniref:NEDD8-activating enzyme E1 regulatory subunit n=1 Tax=Mesorhabditis belari TaxID=2138241 RepID=A0AAF3FI80_9BILA